MFDPNEVQKITGNFDNINIDDIDIKIKVIKTGSEEASESGEDDIQDAYLSNRNSWDSLYVHDGNSTDGEDCLAIVKTGRCRCCNLL